MPAPFVLVVWALLTTACKAMGATDADVADRSVGTAPKAFTRYLLALLNWFMEKHWTVGFGPLPPSMSSEADVSPAAAVPETSAGSEVTSSVPGGTAGTPTRSSSRTSLSSPLVDQAGVGVVDQGGLRKRKTPAEVHKLQGWSAKQITCLQQQFRLCFQVGQTAPLRRLPADIATEWHGRPCGRSLSVVLGSAGTFIHGKNPGEDGSFSEGVSPSVFGREIRVGQSFGCVVQPEGASDDIRMGAGNLPSRDSVRLVTVVAFADSGSDSHPLVHVNYMYRWEDRFWLSGHCNERLTNGSWSMLGLLGTSQATDLQVWALPRGPTCGVESVVLGTSIYTVPLTSLLGPVTVQHTADFEAVSSCQAPPYWGGSAVFAYNKVVNDWPGGKSQICACLPNAINSVRNGACQGVDLSTEGGRSNFMLNLAGPIAAWYVAITPDLVKKGDLHRHTIPGVGFTLFCLLAQHQSCEVTMDISHRSWTALWVSWAALGAALEVLVRCKPAVETGDEVWAMEGKFGICLTYSHDSPGVVCIHLSATTALGLLGPQDD